MITTMTIWEDSVRSVDTQVTSDADPTGTVPYFALSALDATEPGSFVAGAWAVTYNSTTDKATARSSTLGATGSHVIATGNSYRLWLKVTVGGETIIEPVVIVHCP